MKALLTLLLALFALPAFAEDWKTTDGKVYVNVKVVRVEDDAVTILDKDGGALVPLNKLDPTLQKRFSYDPVKAKAAADARAAADAANAKQLQAEMDLAKQIKLKQQIEAAKEKDEADGVTNAPTSP